MLGVKSTYKSSLYLLAISIKLNHFYFSSTSSKLEQLWPLNPFSGSVCAFKILGTAPTPPSYYEMYVKVFSNSANQCLWVIIPKNSQHKLTTSSVALAWWFCRYTTRTDWVRMMQVKVSGPDMADGVPDKSMGFISHRRLDEVWKWARDQCNSQTKSTEPPKRHLAPSTTM